jgi:hypothetical protein
VGDKMEDNDISKKITLTIADFAVESGLSLIPGASIPYSGIKKIVELVQDYNQYKHDKKIQQFVSSIFENISLDNINIDIDDFSKVLDLCLRDFEDEKSEIYGKFCKGLVKNGLLPNNLKKELILTIRELTMGDILFLKKLYIHARHNINNYNGRINYLFNCPDVQAAVLKNRFLNHSLVDFDNDTITKFSELFIKTIFDESELTPENIGMKEWRKIVIGIVSYQLDNSKHIEIATEIERLCIKERISTSTVMIMERNLNSAKLLFSAGVLIIDKKDIEDKYIEILNDFSKRRPLFVINIDRKTEVFFNKINFTKLFHINNVKQLEEIYENIAKEYKI